MARGQLQGQYEGHLIIIQYNCHKCNCTKLVETGLLAESTFNTQYPIYLI